MGKHLLTIASLASLMLVAIPGMAAAGIEAYNVVWNSPSSDFAGSMPLGDGGIAVNSRVEPSGDPVFYIARTDGWGGSLDGAQDVAYGLIKGGRVRVPLSPNPFANATDFRQAAKRRYGAVETSADPDGKKSRLRLWADSDRPVAQVEDGRAVPVTMKVAMESWHTTPTQSLGADSDGIGSRFFASRRQSRGRRAALGFRASPVRLP